MESTNKDLDESLKIIAKGTSIGFIGLLIGGALGYVFRILIARFLGAADYGLLTLGFAAMSIAGTLSLFGLQEGVGRNIAFYRGRQDPGRIKGMIVGAVKIALPLSLFFTISFFIGAGWISHHVFREPHLMHVLQIFAIAVPFFVLFRIFIAATVGFQDMRYHVYVDQIFYNVFKLGAAIVLLALGFGVLGAAWGWALAIIAMPFLSFYFLEKKVFPILKTKIKAISVEKELLMFSYPLIFAGFSIFIINWTDTLMLGYFSSAQEVGIYNAAVPTARLIRHIIMAFGGIFMPVLSALFAQHRSEELSAIYSTVTKWVLSLAFPAFLLMVLFSHAILKILFGDEFTAGSAALAILAGGYVINALLGLSDRIIQAFGRTRIIMWCNLVGAISNVILNLYLIPRYGINGAAVATALSVVLMSSLTFIFANRTSGMQPFRFSNFKPIVTSMIAVVIVYVITKYIFGISFLVLIIMLPVFFVLYFILLLLAKGFEEEDLMIMRAIDQRLGIRSAWIRKLIGKFL